MGFCRICKVEYGTDRSLKFHRLPKDESTKSEWFRIIGKVVPPSSLVCSKHFSEDDYVLSRNGQKKTLKAGSIPELNVEDSNVSSLTFPSMSVWSVDYSSNDNIQLVEVKEECEDDSVSTDNVISFNDNETSGENSEYDSPEPVFICPRKTIGSYYDHSTPKKLRVPRYPRDLGPDHFVRKEDYDMLSAYLIKKRNAGKRVSNRINRWKKQITRVENLLSELEEQGLVPGEAADTIRSSLPNIFSEEKEEE